MLKECTKTRNDGIRPRGEGKEEETKNTALKMARLHRDGHQEDRVDCPR